MPILYIVGTPIGNLEDITLRALRVLGEVQLIAAEDTRTTGRLLNHYSIATPMVSYHEYSGTGRITQLVSILETGDVALVSDAGTPGLSDPGYRLIQAAVEADIAIVPIPGPSAAVTALVCSGLPTDSFLFLGFLPRRKTARQAQLRAVASLPYTLVLYEAPHRLLSLLQDVVLVLGDRPLSIGRELTKLHEEIWRGLASEASAHFSQVKIRGEITVIIAGFQPHTERWSENQVRQSLDQELANGLSRKEAAAKVAQLSGWRKKDVYNLA